MSKKVTTAELQKLIERISYPDFEELVPKKPSSTDLQSAVSDLKTSEKIPITNTPGVKGNDAIFGDLAKNEDP